MGSVNLVLAPGRGVVLVAHRAHTRNRAHRSWLTGMAQSTDAMAVGEIRPARQTPTGRGLGGSRGNGQQVRRRPDDAGQGKHGAIVPLNQRQNGAVRTRIKTASDDGQGAGVLSLVGHHRVRAGSKPRADQDSRAVNRAGCHSSVATVRLPRNRPRKPPSPGSHQPRKPTEPRKPTGTRITRPAATANTPDKDQRPQQCALPQ